MIQTWFKVRNINPKIIKIYKLAYKKMKMQNMKLIISIVTVKTIMILFKKIARKKILNFNKKLMII